MVPARKRKSLSHAGLKWKSLLPVAKTPYAFSHVSLVERAGRTGSDEDTAGNFDALAVDPAVVL